MVNTFFNFKADFPNRNIFEFGQYNKSFIAFEQARQDYVTYSVSTIAKGNTDIYISSTNDKDGFIWICPLRNTGIIRLNPSTDTATVLATPGGSGTNRFHGIVYWETTHSLYLSPYDSTHVRKYNIATNTFSDIGSSLGDVSGKFGNGLRANNKIYFAPHSPFSGSSRFLSINPTTDAVSSVTVTSGNTFSCQSMLVYAPNDFIYMFNALSPFSGIKIDVTNDTFTWLSNNLDREYVHAVLDPVTDDVWLTSRTSPVLCRWSYKTEAIVATYSYPQSTDKIYSMQVSNNGRLYGTSLDVQAVYEINTKPTTPVFTKLATDTEYRFATLATNGCIYSPANSQNKILKINTNNAGTLTTDHLLNSFLTQF